MPAMAKISMKLSSTIASLLSIMLDCEFLLLLMLNIIDPKNVLLGTWLLN
jgi:hypothetical protein